MKDNEGTCRFHPQGIQHIGLFGSGSMLDFDSWPCGFDMKNQMTTQQTELYDQIPQKIANQSQLWLLANYQISFIDPA